VTPEAVVPHNDGTMALQGSPTELARDTASKAVEQVGRILASKSFRQSDRLKRFLSFIVDETIAGRGERLKEFVVGVEVFGKPPSFDPRNDPIVRVQARRLRAQLARYYKEEAAEGELVIDLPKGGYAPVFRAAKTASARQRSVPALLGRNTAVVRPFADHSAAGDHEAFCHGLTEETIRALAGIESVRLLAWDGAAESETAAAILVTGSVRTAGDRARISVNIVDRASGSYLWSGALDRKLDDVFAVQEEVARVAAGELKRQLSGGHARRPTENLTAYNLYVQGRYHLNQRTEEGLRKAVEFFERAIAEDAQYAEAYSGLSDAYGLLGHYGVLSPAEVWTKAASNAAWAVLHDDNSAEAHTSLAHVKSTQDWDWLGSEQEFRRAIALDPRYATAHHWYAMSCLAPLGRLEEARDELLLAQALDPVSSIIGRDLARVNYYMQDFDAALEQCDRTVELNPHFSPGYWILGLVQEQRGDFDESAAAFQRAIELAPGSPLMRAALGRTLALSGKRDDARRILRDMETLADSRYVSPFELASIYFAMEQAEDGFVWLTKAFHDRCFELICLRVDPRWELLRGNVRFKKLVEQLGLP
jgi:TolB-like protein/Flp pilus assembly protein TadD